MGRPRSKTISRPSTAPVVPLAALPSLPSSPTTRQRGKTFTWSQTHGGTPLDFFVSQSFVEHNQPPKAFDGLLYVHYPSERERPVIRGSGDEEVVDLFFTFSLADAEEEPNRVPADDTWGKPGCHIDAEAPLFLAQDILSGIKPGESTSAVKVIAPVEKVDEDDDGRGGGVSSSTSPN